MHEVSFHLHNVVCLCFDSGTVLSDCVGIISQERFVEHRHVDNV